MYHQQYLSNLIASNNNNKNLKCSWHYIKSKRQDNVGIGALKNQPNDMITDSTQKAKILNKQFKSVFTIKDTNTIPDKGTSPYPSIPDINVTLDGVRYVLLKSDLKNLQVLITYMLLF